MKQIFLLAPLTVVLLASCKKDVSNDPVNSATPIDALATAKKPLTISSRVDLKNKLDAWFPFNQNLSDTTGKIYSMPYPYNQGPHYTADHKGRSGASLNLTGAYMVYVNYTAPQKTTSLSVWIKRQPTDLFCEIISPKASGPGVFQSYLDFLGSADSLWGQNVYSSPVVDDKWHHVVVTCDGQTVKLYVDAVYQGSKTYNAVVGAEWYRIGFTSSTDIGFWKGCIDDLRFYSRTLSQEDVTALFDL